MKEHKHTLEEVVHHIITSHHELLPLIEERVFQAQDKSSFDANLLISLNKTFLEKSQSQLRQDIFVLNELGYKRNGFFVEFGATDGVELSNTYLLETEFGWNGILAEAATIWHADLDRNRKARIDKRCVWKQSGETLMFNETEYHAGLSTIDIFSFYDTLNAKGREIGKKYPVQTISLMDLLEEHQAPTEIDYLSIDTEGSEFSILENFDFEKYRFKIITCEHNYTPMRKELELLFQKNGYRKKYEEFSQIDDWWVYEG